MLTLPAAQLKAFAHELDALRNEIQKTVSAEDIRHLRKIERWGRMCSLVGFLTAWIPFNPIAALLISQGKTNRKRTLFFHRVSTIGNFGNLFPLAAACFGCAV